MLARPPRSSRQSRRALAVFAGVLAAAVAAAAVAIALNTPNRDPERVFPPYWNQLEEGETTRAELIARLGPPDRSEGSCLLYDDLVDRTAYRFCFRAGVLNVKSAY